MTTCLSYQIYICTYVPLHHNLFFRRSNILNTELYEKHKKARHWNIFLGLLILNNELYKKYKKTLNYMKNTEKHVIEIYSYRLLILNGKLCEKHKNAIKIYSYRLLGLIISHIEPSHIFSFLSPLVIIILLGF